MSNQKPSIGGQAVIEGVMIRNKNIYSIAVRKDNGDIEVIKRDIKSPANVYKILRSPFIRGITALVENLVLGIKSLLYSAEAALPEEETKKKGNRSNLLVVLGVIPALLLGVVLFIILPNFSVHFLGIIEKDHPFLFNLAAGFIRLSVFVVYILVISFIKDIKRTFQYHGAEHKSIFCYESGKPLVVEEASQFKTLHPRCGTSFLFFVFFITIVVFPMITVGIRLVYSDFTNLSLIYRKAITIFLHILVALPIIASISYELLKLSDKLKSSILVKALIAPGLFLQKITTREPEGEQLEVALEAVKAVL
ncbi:MAG: DUF1385 domain-containing protein [Spirochaetota bacterium]